MTTTDLPYGADVTDPRLSDPRYRVDVRERYLALVEAAIKELVAAGHTNFRFRDAPWPSYGIVITTTPPEE